jgi:hypothetical protein
MIHNNALPQKKYSSTPTRIYFKTLNQGDWERLEKATSSSRFIV